MLLYKPNSRNYTSAAIDVAMAWFSVARCRSVFLGVEVSIRQFHTTAELSWVRSVLTPNEHRNAENRRMLLQNHTLTLFLSKSPRFLHHTVTNPNRYMTVLTWFSVCVEWALSWITLLVLLISGELSVHANEGQFLDLVSERLDSFSPTRTTHNALLCNARVGTARAASRVAGIAVLAHIV